MLVVTGADGTLGVDSRRGIEIAVDDKGGKLLGHTIKLDGQDSGCGAEPGQAAAAKLAADTTIVGVIGSGSIGPDLAYGFVSALASGEGNPDIPQVVQPRWYNPITFPAGSRKRAVISGASVMAGRTCGEGTSSGPP